MAKIFVQTIRVKNGMGFEQPITSMTTIVGKNKPKNARPDFKVGDKAEVTIQDHHHTGKVGKVIKKQLDSVLLKFPGEEINPDDDNDNWYPTYILKKANSKNGMRESTTDIYPQLKGDKTRIKEPGYDGDLKNASFKVGDKVEITYKPERGQVGKISKIEGNKYFLEEGPGDAKGGAWYYAKDLKTLNSGFTKELAVAERRGASADMKKNTTLPDPHADKVELYGQLGAATLKSYLKDNELRMAEILKQLEVARKQGREMDRDSLLRAAQSTAKDTAKLKKFIEAKKNSDRLKPTDVQSETNSKKNSSSDDNWDRKSSADAKKLLRKLFGANSEVVDELYHMNSTALRGEFPDEWEVIDKYFRSLTNSKQNAKPKFAVGDKVTQIYFKPGNEAIITKVDTDPAKSYSGKTYYALKWIKGMEDKYKESNKWFTAEYLKKV